MKLKRILIIFAIAISLNGHTNASVCVDKFETNAYGIDDMPKSITPKLELSLTILQMSYKAHLDEVIATKNPYLLKSDNYKYFLSVYGIIFNEIAKMKLNIKENDNSVHYCGGNPYEVIKCNFAKNIAQYTRRNWSYILLINVLNQVKNSNKQVDINLIKDTAKHITEDNEYKIYQDRIESAEYDLIQYFDQLDLYKYLTAVRKFDFDTMCNNLKKDFELGYPAYNEVSRNYNLNNLSINVTQTTFAITRKTNSWERIVLSINDNYYKGKTKNDKLFLERRRSWGLYSSPLGLYFTDSMCYQHHKINLPKLDLKRAYSWEDILYDHPMSQENFEAFFVEFFKPAFLFLLTKAHTGNIDRMEKVFLDIYSQYKYKVFCCYNMYDIKYKYSDLFIHCFCNDDIVKRAYDIMKRVEDELLCDMESNASIKQIRKTYAFNAKKCITHIVNEYLSQEYVKTNISKYLAKEDIEAFYNKFIITRMYSK